MQTHGRERTGGGFALYQATPGGILHGMGLLGEKFEGVRLVGDTLFYKLETHPVAGATARVELGGDIGKRVTATRVMALGVFALAAKKKTGHAFLTIEGDDFALMVEVPVKRESDARKFAAKVNTAAKG